MPGRDQATPAKALALLASDLVADEGYTRPTADGLYPHQWNWDTAFIALGWSVREPDRGYRELLRLTEAQTPSGFIPHIAFSQHAGDYFPASECAEPRPGRRPP